MTFPTTVSAYPAPAVEGDFCDANPRASVDAGPGGLVVGSGGAVIGRFHWATAPLDPNGTPTAITNTGTGAPTGFLHREQQGLITTYLTESGMAVPPGFPITLMKGGGYWAKNAGGSATAITHKVFARLSDGAVLTGTAGATISGAVETKFHVHSVAAAGELFKFSSLSNG